MTPVKVLSTTFTSAQTLQLKKPIARFFAASTFDSCSLQKVMPEQSSITRSRSADSSVFCAELCTVLRSATHLASFHSSVRFGAPS